MILIADTLQKHSLNSGIIQFPYQVDSGSVARLIDELNYLNTKEPLLSEITLYIMSEGGDAYAGLGAYDMLRQSVLPVTGIVVGYAASAAVMILLQGCRQRHAMPNARLLFHEARTFLGTAEEGHSQRRLSDGASELSIVQDQVDQILVERTGRSLEDVQTLCTSRDVWLSAQEALQWNIIDRIVGGPRC